MSSFLSQITKKFDLSVGGYDTNKFTNYFKGTVHEIVGDMKEWGCIKVYCLLIWLSKFNVRCRPFMDGTDHEELLSPDHLVILDDLKIRLIYAYVGLRLICSARCIASK